MPTVSGVLETALYVEDLDRAARFYEDLFGFESLFADERLCAFNVAGKQVLLLFKKGASRSPQPLPGGVIPPHDAAGQIHFALSIPAADLTAWEEHLTARAIAIESRIHWGRGGQSLYFRDPDQNLVELATPGLWAIY
ncbi:MAG TPA: VOC family protein [Chthonomonadaceae bacterium]|nr:VOC family protein [Chthonomonadaceae bacterium]